MKIKGVNMINCFFICKRNYMCVSEMCNSHSVKTVNLLVRGCGGHVARLSICLHMVLTYHQRGITTVICRRHTCTYHLAVINVTGRKRSVWGEEGVRRSEALEVHIDPLNSQTFDMELYLPDNQLMQCDTWRLLLHNLNFSFSKHSTLDWSEKLLLKSWSEWEHQGCFLFSTN